MRSVAMYAMKERDRAAGSKPSPYHVDASCRRGANFLCGGIERRVFAFDLSRLEPARQDAASHVLHVVGSFTIGRIGTGPREADRTHS